MKRLSQKKGPAGSNPGASGKRKQKSRNPKNMATPTQLTSDKSVPSEQAAREKVAATVATDPTQVSQETRLMNSGLRCQIYGPVPSGDVLGQPSYGLTTVDAPLSMAPVGAVVGVHGQLGFWQIIGQNTEKHMTYARSFIAAPVLIIEHPATVGEGDK